MAIQFEKSGIVKRLLKGGAKVNAGNIHNSMLFHEAVEKWKYQHCATAAQP
jgi:hypothetical protein